jgi:hypothetical protein
MRLLARRPDGIFVAPFEQGEIGPNLFRAACRLGLEGLVSKRCDRFHQGCWPISGQSNLNHWLPLSDSAYTQPAIGVIHAMSAPTASLRMAIGQIEFTMRWAADG